MLRSAAFIAVATLGIAGLTTAVLAEDNGAPPNCPGGNLKGTITCTGPVLHPTCTEGPPWTCELTKDKDPPKATLGGDGSGHHRFNFGNITTGGQLMVDGGNKGSGPKTKNLMFSGAHKLQLN